MARKPNETIHLKLRMPEFVRKRLAKEAAARKFSMNAEVIRRLEWSFDAQDRGEEEREKFITTLVMRLARANEQIEELQQKVGDKS